MAQKPHLKVTQKVSFDISGQTWPALSRQQI